MLANNSEVIPLKSRNLVGMRVDATSYENATKIVLNWAKEKKNSYICVGNVHMVMETYDSPEFARIVNNSDLVTPDGMPLVWALKMFGINYASRVYGPTLTLHICQASAEQAVPIGLYGGTPESLKTFTSFLNQRFPGIKIVCQISPPFRSLTPEEDAGYTAQIVESGAQILFVGIGCPKQEYWMAAHKDKIPAVMLGVGAAFDFHSGRVKQAPIWIQNMGLEWLFRFSREPKRLWKRYLFNNPRFILFLVLQWIASIFSIKLFKTNS
ncbi:MAG: WecB/TagA/CpsF family glycosyltransferase [Gloeotrichia echinulata CP02]|jgi:N-acetylglucosaminyldiphosphoundecaprenol N-acetyl-beta-D-mannosaminyltransferase